MKRSFGVGSLLVLAVSTASANVAVVENTKTITVDCAKDPEIELIGNHITLTTKGVCSKIEISGNHAIVKGSATTVEINGNHNTVMLAAADDVSIVGNSNTVAVAKPIKLKAPRIANVGTDNQVNQKP